MCLRKWVVIEIGGNAVYELHRHRRPNKEFIRKYWPNAIALEIRSMADEKIGFTFI